MKILLIMMLSVFISHTTFASCPNYLSIYTDKQQNYELAFTKESSTKPATDQDFIISNKITGQTFHGNITYGNGYSIPGVSVELPCPKNSKKKNCNYDGTVYFISDKNTAYGFVPDKPVLFPSLGRAFYYSQASKILPSDIWLFKSCLKK